MNKKSMLGIVLALLAIAAIGVFRFLGDSDMLKEVKQPDAITVKGYVGGEKMGFLANEGVKSILDKKYRITINAYKKGSVEGRIPILPVLKKSIF